MSARKASRPAVADVNKDNAKNNIIRKINLLEAWAKNGIPYVVTQEPTQVKGIRDLEYFPRSVRQFNFWDGRANSIGLQKSLPQILRNANDTLRNHPDLRKLVEDVLEALVARETLQKNMSKPIKIKKVSDSLAIERKLRIIAETELINIRKQQNSERRDYSICISGLNSQIDELKRLVSELQSQNQEAAREISILKASLMKVAPLKGI